MTTGGKPRPVYVVTDAEIASGEFSVAPGPAHMVSSLDEAARGISGGPSVPVYVVDISEATRRGVIGGQAHPVFDMTDSGRPVGGLQRAVPVYVVTGSLGGVTNSYIIEQLIGTYSIVSASLGESFKIATIDDENYKITRISWWHYRTFDADGDIVFAIRSSINGSDLCTVTIPASDLSIVATEQRWYTFTDCPELTSNTSYYLVMYRNNWTAGTVVNAFELNTNPYPDGIMYHGSTPNNLGPTTGQDDDMQFIIEAISAI